MAFHEVQFPTDISYGSSGGPGFDTAIIEVDSGAESRVSRRSIPRHRYNAAYGVKTSDQLASLKTFYVARLGPAIGFRYKDFADYTTNANGSSAPSNVDCDIGVGDGSKTQFQLCKEYTSGPVTRTRPLLKPVASTTVVALDAVNQSSGWSVDTTTGIVTFSAAPSVGVVVSAGCEFDVPVRFGAEIDELLESVIENFNDGTVSSIPLVELLGDAETDEEFYYGGAIDHGAIVANISLSTGNGRVQRYSPTVAGIKAILPATTTLEPGGPYFVLSNGGTQAVEIRDSAGATVAVHSSGTIINVYLGLNTGGTKIWLAG